jgi:hypothetical protein
MVVKSGSAAAPDADCACAPLKAAKLINAQHAMVRKMEWFMTPPCWVD